MGRPMRCQELDLMGSFWLGVFYDFMISWLIIVIVVITIIITFQFIINWDLWLRSWLSVSHRYGIRTGHTNNIAGRNFVTLHQPECKSLFFTMMCFSGFRHIFEVCYFVWSAVKIIWSCLWKSISFDQIKE